MFNVLKDLDWLYGWCYRIKQAHYITINHVLQLKCVQVTLTNCSIYPIKPIDLNSREWSHLTLLLRQQAARSVCGVCSTFSDVSSYRFVVNVVSLCSSCYPDSNGVNIFLKF